MSHMVLKKVVASGLSVALLMSQPLTAIAADETSELLTVSSEDELVEETIDEYSEEELLTEDLEEADEELLEDAAESASASSSQEDLLLEESDEAAEEVTDETLDTSDDISDDISDNNSKEEEVVYTDELPEGMNAMPEGYTLSEAEKEIKHNLATGDHMEIFETLTEGVDYPANEVICYATSEEEAQAIANAYSGELKEYAYGVATISLTDSELSVAQAFKYAADETINVPAVEPNYIVTINDPDEVNYSNEPLAGFASVTESSDYDVKYHNYDYNDPALDPLTLNDEMSKDYYQWFHDMINTYAAWGVTTGDPSIRVAVIDTGVQQNHADLKGSFVESALDKHGNRNGANADHGTHVAGLITGNLNNGIGGAGVAPNVTVVPINAYTIEKTSKGIIEGFTKADVARSILYVAGYELAYFNENNDTYSFDKVSETRRADIINLSIGGYAKSALEEAAINVAHDAGVTVIAAMGNESANNISYPAGYKNAIAVAAVNEKGLKADFSTYGSWCDVAAPGTNIYSTVWDGTASGSRSPYEVMNGTSMATPIVSGACALYMSAYGYQTPDKMRAILRKSTNKCSSAGTGTGIIDLAKMMGVDAKTNKVDTTAPTVRLLSGEGTELAKVADSKKPTLTVKNVVAADSELTFEAMNFGGDESKNANTKIVYTTNGKAPKISKGVITVGNVLTDRSEWYGKSIKVSDIVGKTNKNKKVTVKVMAVTALGKASKVTTLTFTVAPTITSKAGIGEVKVTGQDYIPAGTTATFKATVLPGTAKNKKVTWSFESKDIVTTDDNSKPVSLNAKTGKLTVAKTATSGTITVKATCAADNTIVGEKTVTVVTAKTTAIKVTAPDADAKVNIVKYAKKTGSISTLRLYSVDIDKSGSSLKENEITLHPTVLQAGGAELAGTKVAWSSSNSRVAKVVTTDSNDVVIHAVNKGTATITCKALDGSKKKVTLKVNVIVPASGISLYTKNDQSMFVAEGKSATTGYSLGKAYGTPTVSKVKWTYNIYPVNYDIYTDEVINVGKEDVLSASNAAALVKAGYFKFNAQTGKLSLKKIKKYSKDYNAYQSFIPDKYNDLVFEVVATTTDGTGLSASKIYHRAAPTTVLVLPQRVRTDMYGHITSVVSVFKNDTIYLSSIGKSYKIYSNSRFGGDLINNQFQVKSSNPNIATAYAEGDQLYVIAKSKGKATIKVKATDGTNKTCTLKVTIK